MPDHQHNISPADEGTEHTPRENYEVGYCRPPVAHRFKPGNKANPRGRTKGTRNRKLVIQEVLFEPVTVRDATGTRQMAALEAVVRKLLSKALGGDNKAAFTIVGIAQKEGFLTSQQEQAVKDLSEIDQAILEDAKRRFSAAVIDASAEATVDSSPRPEN